MSRCHPVDTCRQEQCPTTFESLEDPLGQAPIGVEGFVSLLRVNRFIGYGVGHGTLNRPYDPVRRQRETWHNLLVATVKVDPAELVTPGPSITVYTWHARPPTDPRSPRDTTQRQPQRRRHVTQDGTLGYEGSRHRSKSTTFRGLIPRKENLGK